MKCCKEEWKGEGEPAARISSTRKEETFFRFYYLCFPLQHSIEANTLKTWTFIFTCISEKRASKCVSFWYFLIFNIDIGNKINRRNKSKKYASSNKISNYYCYYLFVQLRSSSQVGVSEFRGFGHSPLRKTED